MKCLDAGVLALILLLLACPCLWSASLVAHGDAEGGSRDGLLGCYSQNSGIVGPVTAGCSGPIGFQGLFGGEASTSSETNYNLMTDYAHQSAFSQTGSTYFSDVFAFSSMSDNIGIDLPAGYSSALVSFSYTITATHFGKFTLTWGGTCTRDFAHTAMCTETQRLMPGNTIDLQVELDAHSEIGFTFAGGDTTLLVAQLSGVQILDDNLNSIPGARLISDSGFDYQDNVIPEPPTVILLLAPLGLLGILAQTGVSWRERGPDRGRNSRPSYARFSN